jgi:hypothetical protein
MIFLRKRKGQFELAMMIFMLVFIATLFLILILGMHVQGRQSYRVQREVWEPNKYNIVLNSLLRVNNTRGKLINYSYGLNRKQMAEDINLTLKKMFPARKAVLEFSDTTFGNGIKLEEEAQEFNKTTRTIFYPQYRSNKAKLKIWVDYK